MATGSSVSAALETISRHHLECSICQERYQHPKILECLHSFCEQCLLKYCSTKHQGCTEIPCPVCRQETGLPETGVGGLKTNFYLIGLVEEIALQEKVASSGDTKLLCEICDEDNEATHRCLDCAQNICLTCHKVHNRFGMSSNHTIATLDEIRQGRVTPTKKHQQHHPKCPNHEGEVTRFFCTTCEMLICGDCTVIQHCKPQHAYIESNLVTSTYKQSLAELFAPLEETLKELEESREAVSGLKHELGIRVDRIMREVQDKAAEIRAEVTAQENRLIDQIKSIQTDRHQTMDEYEKTMSLLSERIQYSLETARDVTRTASDSDFLSLYPTISKDLKSLTGQNTREVDRSLSFLKFQQSGEVSDINLGKVTTGDKWKLCREFGGLRRGQRDFDRAYGVAIWKPGEIALTDGINQRVMMFSIDGKYRSTIPTQLDPFGIAATRDNNRLVVVCCNATDVRVFNKDNRLAFQFPTVPPSEVGKTAVTLCSVAVKKDGTIIVGDVKRMVLTEHSPSDGSLIRTIPVKTTPYFLAVDSNDRVIISAGLESQAVDVIDGNGATIFTIKPTIQGTAVRHCNGVYADSSGIYVAMYNSFRNGHTCIHHYDTQGVFLRCIARGLYHPQGITFTSDGQLVVADWHSVKVYQEV